MGIAEGCMLGVLGGLAAYDMKTKRVPVVALAVAGLLAVVYRLCTGTELLDLVTGLIPGVVLLMLAYVTKESIGTGDGGMLCVMGLFYGVTEVLAILGMALVLAAVTAIVLLTAHRAGRKTELPFLPFLFLGSLLCMWW